MMHSYAPPEPPSYFREHWHQLFLAVMGPVLVAATLAGWGDIRDTVSKWRNKEPVLIEAAYGNWRFVRFEPEPPTPKAGEPSFAFKSLQLLHDKTYIVVVTTSIPNGPALDNQGSGTFTVKDKDTIKFQRDTGGFGEVDLAVKGNQLRMSSPVEDLTAVFRRV